MLKVGQLINIEVIDHLIISEENFTSLADEGIIKELHKSDAFELMDREKQELKEWSVKTHEKRATKLATAEKMLSKGYDIDAIKEITALTKWD